MSWRPANATVEKSIKLVSVNCDPCEAHGVSCNCALLMLPAAYWGPVWLLPLSCVHVALFELARASPALVPHAVPDSAAAAASAVVHLAFIIWGIKLLPRVANLET